MENKEPQKGEMMKTENKYRLRIWMEMETWEYSVSRPGWETTTETGVSIEEIRGKIPSDVFHTVFWRRSEPSEAILKINYQTYKEWIWTDLEEIENTFYAEQFGVDWTVILFKKKRERDMYVLENKERRRSITGREYGLKYLKLSI